VNRGLTLVEVLVATALLAIVVASTVPLLSAVSAATAQGDRRIEQVALLSVLAARITTSPEWAAKELRAPLDVEWPADLAARAREAGLEQSVIVEISLAEPEQPESEASLRAESTTADESHDGAASEANRSERDVKPALAGDWVPIRCGGVVIYRWLERSNKRAQTLPTTRSAKRVSDAE